MYLVFWQYTVKPSQINEFLRHYNSEGTWAQFFKQDSAYYGTQLLQDTAQSGRFVTIDRWQSKSQYKAFRDLHSGEYHHIDQMCEALTETEDFLGEIELGLTNYRSGG